MLWYQPKTTYNNITQKDMNKFHMTIVWKNNGTPQNYFLEENVFFISFHLFLGLKIDQYGEIRNVKSF